MLKWFSCCSLPLCISYVLTKVVILQMHARGPGQSGPKKIFDKGFFVLFFYSTAYFTEVKWSISKKSIIFSRFQRGSNIFQGVQHFPGGSNIFQGGSTFSRGSNCLFPKETHITCDFPGGGGGPDPLSPPLDPLLKSNNAGAFRVYDS